MQTRVPNLLYLRTKRGLTQRELSELANVNQATISELESGKQQRADFDTLERLATALGVSLARLFEAAGK